MLQLQLCFQLQQNTMDGDHWSDLSLLFTWICSLTNIFGPQNGKSTWNPETGTVRIWGNWCATHLYLTPFFYHITRMMFVTMKKMRMMIEGSLWKRFGGGPGWIHFDSFSALPPRSPVRVWHFLKWPSDGTPTGDLGGRLYYRAGSAPWYHLPCYLTVQLDDPCIVIWISVMIIYISLSRKQRNVAMCNVLSP